MEGRSKECRRIFRVGLVWVALTIALAHEIRDTSVFVAMGTPEPATAPLTSTYIVSMLCWPREQVLLALGRQILVPEVLGHWPTALKRFRWTSKKLLCEEAP